MKLRFVILSFLCFSVVKSYSCEPPKDLTYVQPGEYSTVLSSSSVINTLRSLGGQDIQSIVYDNGQYILNSSNGCFVKTSLVYASGGSPGMCPPVTGVKIIEAKCN